MTHYNLHFLTLSLLSLCMLLCFQIKAQETLPGSKKSNSAQAATMPLSEKTLDELASENIRLQNQASTQNEEVYAPQTSSTSSLATPTFKQQENKQSQPSHSKKQKKNHSKSTLRNFQKKQKKHRSWGGLHLNFKWIELDWFMIGLVIALFMGLMILLYFLFVGNTLSLFEMILFAMGFGFAIFSFIFLSSEADGERAAYEFFVKYGVFSWAGIMAIIAGFAGLFGATGSFWSFILIGLVIGGISFVLSLLLGDHLFMGYDQRKRN